METLLPLVAVLAAGCGGKSDRLPLYRASGTVTVDGRPAEGVEVRLVPATEVDNPDSMRPFATSDGDGRFQLGTYEAGDGAPEGHYKATLFWPDRPPGPAHPNDRLGGGYADPRRTPLDVMIEKGQNDLKPFAATTPAKPPSPASRKRPPLIKDSDGLG